MEAAREQRTRWAIQQKMSSRCLLFTDEDVPCGVHLRNVVIAPITVEERTPQRMQDHG
jgi:hypothetical protein